VAKRVSLDVVRNVIRADNAAKRPKARKDGPGRVPSYLVQRLSTYFFQIRPPAGLAPCGASCPPIRVRLGVLPKRDARRRAAWLGTLAQSAFEHWRRRVEGLEYGEFPHGDVGFPTGDRPEEFLANMMTFLKEAAARLENPAPPPVFSPAAMRDLAAIQESVVIAQEVRVTPAIASDQQKRSDRRSGPGKGSSESERRFRRRLASGDRRCNYGCGDTPPVDDAREARSNESNARRDRRCQVLGLMVAAAYRRTAGQQLEPLELGPKGFRCSEGDVVIVCTRTAHLPTLTMCGGTLAAKVMRPDGEIFIAEFERFIDTWAGRTTLMLEETTSSSRCS